MSIIFEYERRKIKYLRLYWKFFKKQRFISEILEDHERYRSSFKSNDTLKNIMNFKISLRDLRTIACA